jgi:hypothetical protein
MDNVQDDNRVYEYCYTLSLETRRRREREFNDFLLRLRSNYNADEWTGMIHEWKEGWMDELRTDGWKKKRKGRR